MGRWLDEYKVVWTLGGPVRRLLKAADAALGTTEDANIAMPDADKRREVFGGLADAARDARFSNSHGRKASYLVTQSILYQNGYRAGQLTVVLLAGSIDEARAQPACVFPQASRYLMAVGRVISWDSISTIEQVAQCHRSALEHVAERYTAGRRDSD